MIHSRRALLFAILISRVAGAQSPIENSADQWPMAAGPNATWTTTSDHAIPNTWSVASDTNVRWKTVLPEGGQSGIAVWNDRIFLTINKPLAAGTPLAQTAGTDIVGYCLNANTGKVFWTAPIRGSKKMPFSGLFSDNTSPTPVTDGKHVWFVNAGGMLACFDVQGHEVWTRPFESRTRHNAKQCEPMLVDDQLLYVMMRDPNDSLRREMRAKPGDRKSSANSWPWTFVRSFDAATGKPLWTESTGTSVHNTPRLGYVNDVPVVFHARGGGHQPPETPYGFNMTSVSGEDGGKSLWTYESRKSVAYVVSHFDENHAYCFDSGSLIMLDSHSGKKVSEFPLFENASINVWDAENDRYVTHEDASFSVVAKKIKKEPTNQTSILVGKYFLYLTHEGHCIGRVDTETGNVEYLQVPAQVVRKPGTPAQRLWGTHIPSDGTNSRGIPTASDRRSKGDGWGHVTSGSPIAVNDFVFFSTMIGMTYVVDSQAKVFDSSALIAINDLGPAGETWSLSAPSYSRGRIFHRGLKHIVCIGEDAR